MSAEKPASVKELLVSLVRIPSVNKFISGIDDTEHGVAAYIEDFARNCGMKTNLLEVAGNGSNLLITKEFSKSAPWIMFAAHMDTVSSDGMDFDPFCGDEKNNRIYGRGSCDDKGSIAASLWALKEIASSPNNIALLFTIDEEQRRHGAGTFAEKQLASIGFMPRGVIVAEPTSLKPVVAHAGIGHFSVTVKGKAAHASEPSKGRSAIKDMVKVMDAIEKNYISGLNAVDPLCGRAQCSINMIQGGRQVNAIPDECTIRVDRRVMPGEDVKGIIPGVERALSDLHRDDPSIIISIKPEFSDSPLSQDLNHPFIKWALNSLKKAGLDAAPIGAQFATDAGALSGAGLPCVVLGPGEAHLAHTANESIGIDELEEGVRVFKAIMSNGYVPA
ncbi:MAG: ArgE/DapE family deacylase [Candidatus Goldiibacteriota bacterium]|jgi:acetylornithine deacetylase